MHDEYQDKPEKIGTYVSSLEGRDRALFEAGFLFSLNSYVEQIVSTKYALLQALMNSDDPEYDIQLTAKIHLLDIYEKRYREQAKVMSDDPSLQAILSPLYA